MKSIKFSCFKRPLPTLLFFVLVFNACAQSSPESQAVNNKVEKITMDLPSAIVSGNLEAVKQHIAAGTDLNKKDPMSGSTPLITATVFDKLDIADALIKAGADLSVKNNDGATALHTAAFFGRVEMVELLLDAKADKGLTNNFGATPRASILGDFEDMRSIYEMLRLQLKPMGLELDLEAIEKARPVIAELLK